MPGKGGVKRAQLAGHVCTRVPLLATRSPRRLRSCARHPLIADIIFEPRKRDQREHRVHKGRARQTNNCVERRLLNSTGDVPVLLDLRRSFARAPSASATAELLRFRRGHESSGDLA